MAFQLEKKTLREKTVLGFYFKCLICSKEKCNPKEIRKLSEWYESHYLSQKYKTVKLRNKIQQALSHLFLKQQLLPILIDKDI